MSLLNGKNDKNDTMDNPQSKPNPVMRGNGLFLNDYQVSA